MLLQHLQTAQALRAQSYATIQRMNTAVNTGLRQSGGLSQSGGLRGQNSGLYAHKGTGLKGIDLVKVEGPSFTSAREDPLASFLSRDAIATTSDPNDLFYAPAGDSKAVDEDIDLPQAKPLPSAAPLQPAPVLSPAPPGSDIPQPMQIDSKRSTQVKEEPAGPPPGPPPPPPPGAGAVAAAAPVKEEPLPLKQPQRRKKPIPPAPLPPGPPAPPPPPPPGAGAISLAPPPNTVPQRRIAPQLPTVAPPPPAPPAPPAGAGTVALPTLPALAEDTAVPIVIDSRPPSPLPRLDAPTHLDAPAQLLAYFDEAKAQGAGVPVKTSHRPITYGYTGPDGQPVIQTFKSQKEFLKAHGHLRDQLRSLLAQNPQQGQFIVSNDGKSLIGFGLSQQQLHSIAAESQQVAARNQQGRAAAAAAAVKSEAVPIDVDPTPRPETATPAAPAPVPAAKAAPAAPRFNPNPTEEELEKAFRARSKPPPLQAQPSLAQLQAELAQYDEEKREQAQRQAFLTLGRAEARSKSVGRKRNRDEDERESRAEVRKVNKLGVKGRKEADLANRLQYLRTVKGHLERTTADKADRKEK